MMGRAQRRRRRKNPSDTLVGIASIVVSSATAIGLFFLGRSKDAAGNSVPTPAGPRLLAGTTKLLLVPKLSAIPLPPLSLAGWVAEPCPDKYGPYAAWRDSKGDLFYEDSRLLGLQPLDPDTFVSPVPPPCVETIGGS